jgi:hypothetical protein
VRRKAGLSKAVLPYSDVPGRLEPGIQRKGGGGINEGKFVHDELSIRI